MKYKKLKLIKSKIGTSLAWTILSAKGKGILRENR